MGLPKYEPLRHEKREIRLLYIMPREFRRATDRELVSCFTVVQQLDNAEPFTALSYVWGDAKDTLPITLNNQVIQVTRNLATALKHIEHDRCRWGIRVFWIDALCINQEDNLEKSHQVQMMGDIYGRASRVLSWLGQATRLTVPAFRWIRSWVNLLTVRYENAYPDRNFGQDLHVVSRSESNQIRTIHGAIYRTILPEIERLQQHLHLLDDCRRMCNNTYWQRVWILQEISNFPSVRPYLGCYSINFLYMNLFCVINNAIWSCCVANLATGLNPQPTGHLSSYINSLGLTDDSKLWLSFQMVALAAWGATLYQIIGGTITCQDIESTSGFQRFESAEPRDSGFQSTKPEDRVFALLGLASDAPLLGLTPDYTRGVREIYTETAYAILRVRGDLALFSYCRIPNPVQRLPSWVPDWSMSLATRPFTSFIDHFRYLSGLSEEANLNQTRATPRIKGSALILAGVVVDTVHATLEDQQLVYEPQPNYENARRVQEFMISAVDFIERHISHPTRSLAQKTNILEALYGIALPNGMFLPQLFEEGAGYGFWEFVRDLLVFRDTTLFIDRVPDDVFPVLCRVQSTLHLGRRVFATQRGFIGLGPDYVQEGDMVVILHGGEIPFVLRPVKDGRPGHYELLGETWMYGMMEGQFMWTNPPTEEFTLV